MTIKAIIREGRLEPVEPLPQNWKDGEEVLVEKPEPDDSPAALEQWADELRQSTAKIPPEEHERLKKALEEMKRESKEAMRRSKPVSRKLARLTPQP